MVKGFKECLITCFALSANFNVEMDSPTLHLTREEEGTIEREALAVAMIGRLAVLSPNPTRVWCTWRAI